MRRWDEARADYHTILSWYPDEPTALQGLADMEQPYEDLPMVDPEFVDGVAQ